MVYSILADVLVAVHVAYVAYVVVGQALILAGLAWHWDWVRNPWYRLTHLAAIGLVALESLFGVACPLTVWEDRLRGWAGQTVAEGSFIGRWLHRLIFYSFEPWVFTVCYLGFALLVLLTFVWAPPRWRRPAGSARAAS